ncbi:hypothetical protein MATL_G00021250 [Megalops atlanticus]|uniref:Uncharacterized protein n=1 Tax=Megalops atlanticus TaxID=7932 RepID=A0A9D3TF90_MEGAT|nr:hypothetical protein MATL_G00021250 [Megalops atlanticus]
MKNLTTSRSLIQQSFRLNDKMISNTIFPVLYGIILVTGAKLCGTNAHESQCNKAEFWNSDVDQCVPCTTCIKYPKTPSCDTCAVQEEASDVWKLVAITREEAPCVSLLRRPQDLFIKYKHFCRV